ncbi:MAG: hypothetical protein A2X86_00050 [Bdellovibrionales bacterium GWA2_49_15]|nr:MAG: hypothetical protein A2X86_00050 [Bdellovibrionales bacterium GWA2_49_15]HAZ14433.1 hypothetical protein [Bdellovibrionales bacterium]
MKHSPKTRQVFLNFSSSMIKAPFTVILGLVSTPLLLKWLGDDRVGLFKILLETIAYIGLMELGLSFGLLNILAKACGSDAPSEAKKVMQVSILAYVKVLPLMLLCSGILFYFMPKIIHIQAGLLPEVLWCFVLIMLSYVFLPLSPFRMLLEVKQRADIVNMIMLTQVILLTAGNLFFAHLGYGLVGQGAAYLFALSITYILFYTFGVRYLDRPFQGISVAGAYKEIREQLWQARTKSFLLQVFNTLSVYTDNVVVGIVLLPKMVVPFILTQKLALLAQVQLNGVGNSAWAPVVDFFHKGEIENFRSKLLETNKIIVILGMSAMVSIALFNQHFLKLWVGDTYYGGPWLNYGVCLFVILNAIISFWGWIFVATGNLGSQIFPTIGGSLINITVSIILTMKIGIAGPILGSLIAIMFTGPWYLFVLLHHRLKIPPGRCLMSVFPGLIMGGVIIYLGEKLLNHFTLPMNWFFLAFYMITLSMFTLISFYLLLLSKNEKKIWWLRIRGFIKK